MPDKSKNAVLSVCLFLLAACEWYGSANPLPTESAIDSGTPLGKIVRLTEFVERPPGSAVCILFPYQQEVNFGRADSSLPEMAAMNAHLRDDWTLTDDGTWGLIISGPEGTVMRTYRRRSFDLDSSLYRQRPTFPDGFTPRNCTRLADAALFKTQLDGKSVLYFGTVAR